MRPREPLESLMRAEENEREFARSWRLQFNDGQRSSLNKISLVTYSRRPVINLTAYPPLSSLSDDEISATVILTLQKSSNIFKPGLYYSYSFDSLQRFVRGVSTISTTREMLGLLKCQNYVTRLDKKYCEVTCCANTFPSLLILAVIA